MLPPKRGQLMMVPGGVRPQLQRTAIEVHSTLSHRQKFNISACALFFLSGATFLSVFCSTIGYVCI